MIEKNDDFPTIPSEIRVEPLLPDGVRYVFPPRALGKLRLFGVIPMVFGMFFSGFAIFWIVSALGAVGGQGGAFGLLFPLFGVPFVFAGFVPMFIGLCMITGRSEIQVRRGRLKAIEWGGPFWWTRSRLINDITRLLIAGGKGLPDSPFMKFMSAINAESGNGKQLLIAPGYPQEWLEPVARDLSKHCETDYSASSSGKRPEVEVVDILDDDEEVSVSKVRPAETKIRCEEHQDGVTIEVPPAGLWKGSKGLFGFSILWCLFMVIFTSIFIFVRDENVPWFVFLFIGLFWVVGIGMMLGAINMGRRRSALVVVDDSLMVLRKGIFGSKKGEWHRADLETVRVGPSGMEVNENPIMELQIVPREGAHFGILSERTLDEQRWIAGQLQKALRFSDKANASTT